MNNKASADPALESRFVLGGGKGMPRGNTDDSKPFAGVFAVSAAAAAAGLLLMLLLSAVSAVFALKAADPDAAMRLAAIAVAAVSGIAAGIVCAVRLRNGTVISGLLCGVIMVIVSRIFSIFTHGADYAAELICAGAMFAGCIVVCIISAYARRSGRKNVLALTRKYLGRK